MSPPTVRAGQLDELTLLRSFAQLHDRFDRELRRVRAALVVGDGGDDQELLIIQRERDMLFGIWRQSYQRRQPVTVALDPDHLRASGDL